MIAFKGSYMKLFFIIATLTITTSVLAKDSCVLVTKDKLCILLEWSQGPFLGAYSENTVKFKDLVKSTQNQEVYRSPKESLLFYGWMKMSDQEHGTRPVKTSLKSDGVYLNSKIFYMGAMMGSWQFKVKIGPEDFVLHAFDI